MPITRRERMLTALAHRQPDVTPWQIDLTTEAREATARYLGDDDFVASIGNHFCHAGDGWFEDLGHHRWRDNFGVIWNRSIDRDIGNVETLLLPEPDLSHYQFPQPDHARNARRIEHMLAENPDVFTSAGIGFSMFERAWTLRGMENLLMDMVLYPQFVDDLLDAILAYNLEALDQMLQYPVDCVRFGDDWGQQRGLIMGPKLWRRFIKPRVAAMYARVKATGKYVMQHSCGDVLGIFPDLIDMGLDIFNTFQPEVMDVDFAKREYGAHLTFYGGISTQQVLPRIAPNAVKAHVEEMIARVGGNGGYLIGPTHAIPRDVPPETIVAFIEAVQHQS
jgi:uroporphyrinogen decarboxylase